MRLPPPRTRRGCLFCLCAAAPLGGGHGALEGACGEGWQLEAVARECEAVAARPRGADAPAAAPSARGRGLRERQGAPISVEVFFLATCPHCYHFVHNSLLPFLDAGLPGGGVVVTLLPLLKGMSSSDSRGITDACSLSLAPLCALKEALPMPAPAGSEALRRGAGFVECDLGLTAMVLLGRDEDATETCSKQAGIPWSGEDGLQACFEGREAFDIMYSTDYADSVVAAMHRLTGAKFTEPPSMPWVFIDGQPFTCEESGSCSSAPGFQKSGERGQGSGALLELVRGMIGDGRGQEQRAKVKKPPKRLNCGAQRAAATCTPAGGRPPTGSAGRPPSAERGRS
ncbi:unnamed protein product [Prorocentrum cordatum]|uniref:Thiol oxidase n=1 Tax=Prorocentrum cordatum TaxID=2364126 RepID=A0ABN9Q6J4_9DINO|nr:unnamed protein product [Polarella glacialis]